MPFITVMCSLVVNHRRRSGRVYMTSLIIINFKGPTITIYSLDIVAATTELFTVNLFPKEA
jgi:hypothetical protein